MVLAIVDAHGRSGRVAMDIHTGLGVAVIVAIVLVAGVYVLRPEK
jgi:hypothetical protein